MAKPAPAQEPNSSSPKLIKLLLTAILITTAMVLSLIVLSVVAAAIFAYVQLNTFTRAAGVSRGELFNTIQAGLSRPATQTDGKKNILLLGVDSLETRGESLPLTDTMMLISLNLQNSTITTLPMPRDLWHNGYRTKINALYTYGLTRYPENPARFPTEALSELTGLPIHHTLVISMDQVAEVIDLMGGITIEVPVGFADTQFPRPDVDVTTERDPAKLYQTIQFQQGTQQMDGQTALAYIRSRHGNNDQNTDDARAERQQLVMRALINKISNPQVALKPKLLGQLYAYYNQSFAGAVSVEEAIATGKELFASPDGLSIRSRTISVYPNDPAGVITHPNPRQYQGLWVYIIREPLQFPQYIQQQLD